ncbi:uncharacterized protein LOC131937345 [Physella acuta]|uniref:uncharacterized protein LOC131937345 n=1 Tax=Physella acuta TaxID=109671 RepID=UPI0027DABB57|nr:uncharacterized protein LOC131937345 [Physella acuta]
MRCIALDKNDIFDPEDRVLYITLGFYLVCTLTGSILVIAGLPSLPKSEWIKKTTSVRSTVTSCFTVLVTTDMILLIPFILFTSVENAFLIGTYTKSYVTCAIGIHMVGFVMTAYGATTPIFAFLFGRLAKLTGRFLLLTLSLAVHIILLAILYLWAPDETDMAALFVVPVVWGVAESVLLAQANSLITMQYLSQKEPAFANFHAWRSLGYFLTYMNSTYFCVSTKLIICMTCAVLGLLLYVVVEMKTRMKEKVVFVERDSVASFYPPTAQDFNYSSSSDEQPASPISPLMSALDRLSYNHVELADIIKEAQKGWRRKNSGYTLEINKLMAGPQLQASKATKLYRTHCMTDSSSADEGSSPYPSSSEEHLKNFGAHGSSRSLERPRDLTRPIEDVPDVISNIIESSGCEDGSDDDMVMPKQEDYVSCEEIYRRLSVCQVPEGTSVSSSFNSSFGRRSFARRLSDTIHHINIDTGPRRLDFEIIIEPPSRFPNQRRDSYIHRIREVDIKSLKPNRRQHSRRFSETCVLGNPVRPPHMRRISLDHSSVRGNHHHIGRGRFSSLRNKIFRSASSSEDEADHSSTTSSTRQAYMKQHAFGETVVRENSLKVKTPRTRRISVDYGTAREDYHSNRTKHSSLKHNMNGSFSSSDDCKITDQFPSTPANKQYSPPNMTRQSFSETSLRGDSVRNPSRRISLDIGAIRGNHPASGRRKFSSLRNKLASSVSVSEEGAIGGESFPTTIEKESPLENTKTPSNDSLKIEIEYVSPDLSAIKRQQEQPKEEKRRFKRPSFKFFKRFSKKKSGSVSSDQSIKRKSTVKKDKPTNDSSDADSDGFFPEDGEDSDYVPKRKTGEIEVDNISIY